MFCQSFVLLDLLPSVIEVSSQYHRSRQSAIVRITAKERAADPIRAGTDDYCVSLDQEHKSLDTDSCPPKARMDSPTNVASVIAGLRNDAEQGRKLAAFSLQGLLADDKFAESFARHGGLPVLRRTLLDERGNTLAYGLGSFTQLLLLGLGWECVTDDVVGLVSLCSFFLDHAAG